MTVVTDDGFVRQDIGLLILSGTLGGGFATLGVLLQAQVILIGCLACSVFGLGMLLHLGWRLAFPGSAMLSSDARTLSLIAALTAGLLCAVTFGVSALK
jgi:hypothetical protein